MTSPRHFLDLSGLAAPALRQLLTDAAALKRAPRHGDSLRGRALALLFAKPSTRTRVSFELAMRQLGGDVVVLSAPDMQLGRGETFADTARVLSRYVDAIMLRTADATELDALARHATVPVINGLTDRSHPCQVLADVMTFEEHRGPIAGQIIAWVGDGNNVAASWVEAAAQFGFELRLATPAAMRPRLDVVDWARRQGAIVVLTDSPAAAVANARCVVTDTWRSMGDRTDKPVATLEPYRVDDRLLAQAADDAVFMHCLPAHRGEEVTASVIDGPSSVVFDEAENRLHVQKAILHWTMNEHS